MWVEDIEKLIDELKENNKDLKSGIKEIQKEEEITINDVLKMIDKILLMQLGIIDAGVKHGFEINNSDLIIDVTMQD